MRPRVCFVGTTRYRVPLDPTTARKFEGLAPLADCVVLALAADRRPRRLREGAEFLLLPNLPTPGLRALQYALLVPPILLWLVLARGVRILVAQSPLEAAVAATAKAFARLAGRRVVLVVESHGDFEVSLFLQRRVRLSPLVRFLMRRACRFSFRHGDLFRAISSFTRQQVTRWAPGRTVLEFPTWSDLDVFFRTPAAPAAPPLVLYAGVLIPRKGVHHLVSAFAAVATEFPGASLALAGAAENAAYTARLEEAARALGAPVRFLGRMDQTDLAHWMQRAHVLVLPSLSEGLGRVVIEAMAVGLPVIASRVGGIPDLVIDGVTGFLVPPGDEAALAERLRRLLRHPDQARAMGARSRTVAGERFSTRRFVDGYAAMFGAAEALLAR